MKDFLNDCSFDKQTIFILVLSIALIISLIFMKNDESYKDIVIAIIGIIGGYISAKNIKEDE